jgi:hypothetical protein
MKQHQKDTAARANSYVQHISGISDIISQYSVGDSMVLLTSNSLMVEGFTPIKPNPGSRFISIDKDGSSVTEGVVRSPYLAVSDPNQIKEFKSYKLIFDRDSGLIIKAKKSHRNGVFLGSVGDFNILTSGPYTAALRQDIDHDPNTYMAIINYSRPPESFVIGDLRLGSQVFEVLLPNVVSFNEYQGELIVFTPDDVYIYNIDKTIKDQPGNRRDIMGRGTVHQKCYYDGGIYFSKLHPENLGIGIQSFLFSNPSVFNNFCFIPMDTTGCEIMGLSISDKYIVVLLQGSEIELQVVIYSIEMKKIIYTNHLDLGALVDKITQSSETNRIIFYNRSEAQEIALYYDRKRFDHGTKYSPIKGIEEDKLLQSEFVFV